MTRQIHVGLAAAGMLAAGIVAGCGSQESAQPQPESMPGMSAPAPGAAAPAPAAGVEITFTPATPKMGENSFEVMVMQDGKAVDDAQVGVEFFMAAIPQMNMPEMRTKTELKPAGSGMYRGTGQVAMGGNWDVTVTAMRNGQEIGRKKLTVAAN